METPPTDSVDAITRVRRRAYPRLHRLAERFGGYVACPIHPAEYVGTVDRTLGAFGAELRRMAFRPEPIAALKYHHDGRQSAGSWVRRRSLFAPKQLHVTVFVNDARGVDTYAHWEDSWLRHPIKHYRAHGWDTGGGVDRMRSLLAHHGVPVTERTI